MKVHFRDGRYAEMSFIAVAVTGVAAESIEVSAIDIRDMYRLAEVNPSQFQITMRQLEARFHRLPLPPEKK